MSFEGCRERIKRAEAHRHNMTEAWNAFLDSDPYTATSYIKDDGEGFIFVTPREGGVPVEIGLLFGEMLYQLRAALDGAVYASAIQGIRNGSISNPEHLEFPIRVNEPVTAQQIKGFMQQIAPLSLKRKKIIELVQPYNTPTLEPKLLLFSHNRSLCFITDLARKDRHRQLHVLGSLASEIFPQVREPIGTKVKYLFPSGPVVLEHKQEVARFKIEGWKRGMEIQTNPNLAIDMYLNGLPVAAHPNDTFDARVKAMIETTKQVVYALERPDDIWVSETFSYLTC